MNNREINRIIGQLRQLAKYRYENKICLENAVHPTIKGPRGGKQFVCAKCSKVDGAKEFQIDHIEPVIPLNKTQSEMSWDEIIERMFCDLSNLQVLCLDCHHEKTVREKHGRL